MGNSARIPVARLGTAALRRVTLPAAGLWKKSGGVLPPDPVEAIMQACVLWYDISKQQATNEGMAANPVLRDLSGNGHDATCYNFAWSGMSGIGGYALDWLSSNWVRIQSRAEFTITHNKVHVTKVLTSFNFLETNGVKNLPSCKVKVTGLNNTERGELDYSSKAPNAQIPRYVIEQDGTYELPANSVDRSVGFSFSGIPNNTEVDVTIELIPEYPNALVSDGVDDYAYVEGLPILTDYTVIAKRKILADKVSALASKATNDYSTDGAFIFDAKSYGGYVACNFGADNALVELYPEDVSYQTKESYNGSPIVKLNHVDTDKLSLFTFSAQNDLVSQYALYSFLLFDRTLTTAEIEWVKKNMIEGGGSDEI